MQIELVFSPFFFLIPRRCCSAVAQIAEVLRTGVCVRSCGTRVPAGRLGQEEEGCGEGMSRGERGREQLAEAKDEGEGEGP